MKAIGFVLRGLFILALLLWGTVFALSLYFSAPRHTKPAIFGDLGSQPVEFSNPFGFRLKGTWIESSSEGVVAPVILLLHGIRADRSAMLERARFLKGLGYSLLLIDFQAHGESDGQHITFGYLESRDAEEAMAYIRRRKPTARIGIIGVSMGGAAALLGRAAQQANAVVLEEVYPDIVTATNNRIRQWLGPLAEYLTPLFIQQLRWHLKITPEQLRPIDAIARLRVPVLILGGSEDLHTTAADTQAMYKRAADPKQVYLFPGARHVDLYDFNPGAYRTRVGEFLKNNLGR